MINEKSKGCPNDEIFIKLLNLLILSESCPKNGVGKIVQQFTSEGPMNCFSELPNQFHLGGLSNVYIYLGGLTKI